MTLSEREKALLAAYGEVWPPPISRERSDSNTQLRLTIEGFEAFRLTLLDQAAPGIAAALRAVLPFEGHLIHSAWSGNGVRALEAFDLPSINAHENATYFPAPGDICYTVGHAELTLFYGDASPAMASGKVKESVFAVLDCNHVAFQQACMLTRLTGVRPFRLQCI